MSGNQRRLEAQLDELLGSLNRPPSPPVHTATSSRDQWASYQSTIDRLHQLVQAGNYKGNEAILIPLLEPTGPLLALVAAAAAADGLPTARTALASALDLICHIVTHAGSPGSPAADSCSGHFVGCNWSALTETIDKLLAFLINRADVVTLGLLYDIPMAYYTESPVRVDNSVRTWKELLDAKQFSVDRGPSVTPDPRMYLRLALEHSAPPDWLAKPFIGERCPEAPTARGPPRNPFWINCFQLNWSILGQFLSSQTPILPITSTAPGHFSSTTPWRPVNDRIVQTFLLMSWNFLISVTDETIFSSVWPTWLMVLESLPLSAEYLGHITGLCLHLLAGATTAPWSVPVALQHRLVIRFTAALNQFRLSSIKSPGKLDWGRQLAQVAGRDLASTMRWFDDPEFRLAVFDCIHALGQAVGTVEYPPELVQIIAEQYNSCDGRTRTSARRLWGQVHPVKRTEYGIMRPDYDPGLTSHSHSDAGCMPDRLYGRAHFLATLAYVDIEFTNGHNPLLSQSSLRRQHSSCNGAEEFDELHWWFQSTYPEGPKSTSSQGPSPPHRISTVVRWMVGQAARFAIANQAQVDKVSVLSLLKRATEQLVVLPGLSTDHPQLPHLRHTAYWVLELGFHFERAFYAALVGPSPETDSAVVVSDWQQVRTFYRIKRDSFIDFFATVRPTWLELASYLDRSAATLYFNCQQPIGRPPQMTVTTVPDPSEHEAHKDNVGLVRNSLCQLGNPYEYQVVACSPSDESGGAWATEPWSQSLLTRLSRFAYEEVLHLLDTDPSCGLAPDIDDELARFAIKSSLLGALIEPESVSRAIEALSTFDLPAPLKLGPTYASDQQILRALATSLNPPSLSPFPLHLPIFDWSSAAALPMAHSQPSLQTLDLCQHALNVNHVLGVCDGAALVPPNPSVLRGSLASLPDYSWSDCEGEPPSMEYLTQLARYASQGPPQASHHFFSRNFRRLGGLLQLSWNQLLEQGPSPDESTGELINPKLLSLVDAGERAINSANQTHNFATASYFINLTRTILESKWAEGLLPMTRRREHLLGIRMALIDTLIGQGQISAALETVENCLREFGQCTSPADGALRLTAPSPLLQPLYVQLVRYWPSFSSPALHLLTALLGGPTTASLPFGEPSLTGEEPPPVSLLRATLATGAQPTLDSPFNGDSALHSAASAYWTLGNYYDAAVQSAGPGNANGTASGYGALAARLAQMVAQSIARLAPSLALIPPHSLVEQILADLTEAWMDNLPDGPPEVDATGIHWTWGRDVYLIPIREWLQEHHPTAVFQHTTAPLEGEDLGPFLRDFIDFHTRKRALAHGAAEFYSRWLRVSSRCTRSTGHSYQRDDPDPPQVAARLMVLVADYPIPRGEATGPHEYVPGNIHIWEPLVPNLIDLLHHPQERLVDWAHRLLDTLAAELTAPAQLSQFLFRITVAQQGLDSLRYPRARRYLIRLAQAPAGEVTHRVSELDGMIRHLQRIAVLWEERLYYLLARLIPRSEALLAQASKGERRGWIRALALLVEPFQQTLRHSWDTVGKSPHERRFLHDFGPALQAVLKAFGDVQCPSDGEKALRRAADLSRRLLQRISTPRVLMLSDLSPWLANMANLSFSIPGTDSRCASLQRFGPNVTVLTTKTKPKKIQWLDSHGVSRTYLLKGMENPRPDEQTMQGLAAFNRWLGWPGAQSLPRIDPVSVYAVVPLGPACALIEWVPAVTSVYQIYRRWCVQEQGLYSSLIGQADDPARSFVTVGASPSPAKARRRATKRYGSRSTSPRRHRPRADGLPEDSATPPLFLRKPLQQFAECLHREAGLRGLVSVPNRTDCPADLLRSVYTNLLSQAPDHLLRQFLLTGSASPAHWYARQTRFTQSLAALSMLGYVLGWGDRHLDNIMLANDTAAVMHIDFSVCFGQGARLRVPETVPFRLTPNFVRALGATALSPGSPTPPAILLPTYTAVTLLNSTPGSPETRPKWQFQSSLSGLPRSVVAVESPLANIHPHFRVVAAETLSLLQNHASEWEALLTRMVWHSYPEWNPGYDQVGDEINHLNHLFNYPEEKGPLDSIIPEPTCRVAEAEASADQYPTLDWSEESVGSPILTSWNDHSLDLDIAGVSLTAKVRAGEGSPPVDSWGENRPHTADQPARRRAQSIMGAIHHRLFPVDPTVAAATAMTQADRVTAQAIDLDNLARMFEGWIAWV